MIYRWANPEHIGVINVSVNPPRYIDTGPEYEAAVLTGPGEFQEYVVTISAEAAAASIAAARATMICSRLQARLALGAATCAVLDAMADDAETPWALAQTLKYAQTWHRTHETMDEIGWALGYTADEIDALFRVAMAL